MAYLVKCSLCGRDVSSECISCPGCGHNVAVELHNKEFEKQKKWEEQGLCKKCGNNEFVEVKEQKSTGYGSPNKIMFWTYYKYAKCAACGVYDLYNYNYHIVSADSRYDGGNNGANYSKQWGNGTWWGARKQKY